MIELPPNQANNQTSVKVESTSTQLAKQSVAQTIQALVVKVEAENASGSQQKALYDILLKVQLASDPSLPPLRSATQQPATQPITQITARELQALQSGQQLLVKTRADFPLPESARILATVSLSNGIVIKSVTAPANKHAQLTALKQLVPQQQGLSQLLANLVELTQSKNNTALKLPPQIQNAIQHLQQILPQSKDLRNQNDLQQAIANSGIFLEAKLKPLGEQLTQNQSGIPNQLNNDNKPVSNSQALNLSIGENLKALARRLMSAVNHSTPQQTNTKNTAQINAHNNTQSIVTSGSSSAINSDLYTTLNRDLKHALNHLRQTLEQAQPKPEANNSNLQNTSNRQQETQLLQKNVKEATTPTPPNTKEGKPLQHNAIRHYSTAAQPAASQNSGKVATEQILIPPLPGQITIQAQGRIKPNIKSNDMADALVSILLKQVKGALARITLHQLASQPQRQEGATSPSMFSFEIPFLHQNQVEVFQFKIEEELSDSNSTEKPQEKRWVVQMGFDIEGLGPMLCQIALVKQTASVSFWAEWENTLNHTKQHFDYLKSALNDMGVRVDKLQGHLGLPKMDKTTLNKQLVDIKT